MDHRSGLKMKNNIIVFIVTLFILTPFVNAFGATTYHWEDSPLEISPGETKQTELVLQNMVGEKDLYLSAEIIEGSDITSILDDETTYFIPFGSKDVIVNLEVSIPDSYEIGGRQNVVVSFKEAVEDEGQMVQMSGAVSVSIPILVKELDDTLEGSPESSGFPYGVVVVLGSMIVVGIILVKYKTIKKTKK